MPSYAPNISTTHDPREGGDFDYSRVDPRNNAIIKSPCPLRPDSSLPCPLATHSKDNSVCYNCQLIGGAGRMSHWEVEATLKSGKIEWYTEVGLPTKQPHVRRVPPKIKTCSYPGCEKKTEEKYCSRCSTLLRQRRRAWRRIHGKKDIPYEWLYRPKRDQGGKEIELQYGTRKPVKDDLFVRGAACDNCGDNLRYAKNNHCVTCTRERSKQRWHTEKAARATERV